MQIDEILGDSSNSENESDEILDVHPPQINQVSLTQNSYNDTENSISSNNNNAREEEIRLTNQQPRNAHPIFANLRNQASRSSQRIRLGGFLDAMGRNIRSTAHGTALTGLMQLASGNENGILSSLGHSNRSNWITQNIDVFFQAGGPLDLFRPVSTEVLQRHLKRAETLAHSIYDSHHSSQGGEDHEDIPDWARSFFQYFEALNNNPTSNQRVLGVRNE